MLYKILILCFFTIQPFVALGNTFHAKASIGDVCFCIDNQYVYLSPKQLKRKKDASVLDAAIGVVYYEDKSIVKIVSGDARKKARWAAAILYKLPSGYCLKKGIHKIFLLKRTKLSIDLNSEVSTNSDLVYILNNLFGDKQLDEWRAFIDDGNVYVAYYGTTNDQMGYDLVIDNKIIDKATSYDAGLPHIFGFCSNRIGQQNWVCGMNKTRMEEHCKYGTNKVFNPSESDMIDGVNKLYSVLPVSYDFFINNSNLKKKFHSYEKYLDACMVDISPTCKGVMTLRDGKDYANRLAERVIPRGNEYVREYPAANIASEYSCRIKNYNDKGHWWLPTMYDLALLMKNIDIVNTTLSLVNKWTPINTSEFYWSCCPNSSYYAWFYHCDGMTDANNMEGADIHGNLLFNVLPITEIPY